MAFVLPILLLIVFGITGFGLAWFRSQSVQAAAREGARLGSLELTTRADIEARVEETLDATTTSSCGALAVDAYCLTITAVGGASASANQPCGSINGADSVSVTVQNRVQQDLPIMALDKTISGTGVFKCE